MEWSGVLSGLERGLEKYFSAFNYFYVISLFLSDRIYIPEQNTSIAEVNSTSEMLIKFYKELSQEFKMEEVNNILKNMGCWCHSHHNMGVSPSGQDVRQFTEFVNSSIEQNQNTFYNVHNSRHSCVVQVLFMCGFDKRLLAARLVPLPRHGNFTKKLTYTFFYYC